MSEYCDKYESLFIFGSEEDLKAHLEECPYCKKEHNEMEKVASLVKEAKPLIKTKRTRTVWTKIAASMIISIFIFYTVSLYSNQLQISNNIDNENISLKENSIIAKMGLPADEYGLLEIE